MSALIKGVFKKCLFLIFSITSPLPRQRWAAIGRQKVVSQ